MTEGSSSGDEAALFRRQFRERSELIVKETGVFFATSVVSKAVVFGFTLYLARVIGPAGLGIFALGVAVVNVVSTVGLAGFPQTAVRYMSLYRSEGRWEEARGFVTRTVGVVLLTGLAGGALVYLLREPLAGLLGSSGLVEYLPAFACGIVLYQMYRLGRETLRGMQEVSRMAVLDLVAAIGTRVLVTVALISLGFGLWGYVTGYLTSLALAGSLLFWAVHRATKGGLGLEAGVPLGDSVRSFARYALGASLVTVLLQRGDRLLLGGLVPVEQVGVYDVAMSVASTLPIGLTAVSAILSPVVANLYEEGRERLTDALVVRANKWVTTLTVPGAICLCVFSREVMGLFGEGFVAGWPVLVLLVASYVIDVAAGSLGLLLSMSGHQREEFQSVAVAVATMIAVDLALIPLWGGVGAAVGFAVAMVAQNWFRRRRVMELVGIDPVGPDFRVILPYLLVGGASVPGLRWLVGTTALPWWLELAIALVLGYLVCVWLVRRFTGDDVDDVIIEESTDLLQRLLPRNG